MAGRYARWSNDAPLWLIGATAAAFLIGMAIALSIDDGPAVAGKARSPGDTAEDAPYRLVSGPDGRLVRLEGTIDFGVTRKLEAMLEAMPHVTLLELESPGGRVAEARGLAKLVERFSLATSARGECSSACTLVFLSGSRRYLESTAKLGFHRYGLHSPLVGVFLDPATEQQRDMAPLRRAGLAEAFLARVAATPHSEMWFPSSAQLMEAGVVDRLGAPN